VGFDLQNFIYQRLVPGETSPSQAFNLSLLHLFGSLAAVFWEDQIVVGIGVESTHAGLVLLQDKGFKDSLIYNGWGIQFGGLWRPAHQNYRAGFSFRPPTVAMPGESVDLHVPPDSGPQGTIGGLQPFNAVVAPARISLGGSYALGSGRDYNIVGREDWVELTGQKLPDGRDETSPAMMKWLFSAQVDIFWPVGNATYISPFLEQAPGVNALPAGDRLSFEPRIAVEKEVLADRLRFRAGGYLEPPLVAWQFPDGTLGPGRTRPHVTFGGEVRIYKKLTFGISFDLAYAYMNLSVALYTWK
jgi:hypothetical protein